MRFLDPQLFMRPVHPDRSLRIVVTGLIAQHPSLGGVAWDYVQYPAALRRMGHDVYYIEDTGEWPYTLDGGASGHDWIARDPAANVAHLAAVMERFGLGDRWAYRFPIEPRWYGMSDERRNEILRSADLLVNVSGTLERPSEYRQGPTLVYIDSDPVFTQVKLALPDQFAEFRDRVHAHDVHFSFGECLHDAAPSTDLRWLPTRQPMLLDEWRPETPRGNRYTTVMSWTSYKPLRYGSETYGQKDVEFERFFGLPALVAPVELEVALGGLQHSAWEAAPVPAGEIDDARLTAPERLRRHGWSVTNSFRTCADLDAYRQYVESSRGEWSVAKNGYVKGQPGWFSCRSSCYLAAGRPVIVQDTGFTSAIPSGDGVIAFRTIEQAADAIRDVEARYAHHATAARDIASTYFDASTVLDRLLERAMNHRPVSVRRRE
jgi:hypothetical protein